MWKRKKWYRWIHCLRWEVVKMCLRMLHKANHYWRPFYDHHVSSNLLSSFATLLSAGLASWLRRPAENVSHAITSDWLRLGKPRKICLNQQVWLQRTANITKLILTEVDTMHTIAICHGTSAKSGTKGTYGSNDLSKKYPHMQLSMHLLFVTFFLRE